MSIAQRLVNLSDGLSADGVLSAAKGGTGNTSGVTGTSSPTISAIGYGGDDTATDVAGGKTITLTGTNFASGAKVLINTTPVGVVTVVSPTQITFTAPANAAGSYILYVVNLDGSTAIAVPGIQYSGVPAWSTAAGTLGTGYETSAVSSTVSAASNSAVTYSVVSGTLPTGVTINASGTISGTSPLVGGSTTYTFTVRATDAENQDTDRSFSLTINPDVVTWSSSNTIALPQNVASTTTLAATSATGQAISYVTDTLPPGLTRSGATVSGTPTAAGTTITTATATAAVTGKTAQQTITWTVSIAADTYFPLTTLLLNSETTALPFLADASTNNFAVTAVGDTKPSNFNPYTPGYYSNYFDGSGDYLSTAYNSAFNVAGGTFTIEAWVNITGTFPANGDANRLGAIAVFGPATVSQGWEFSIDQTNNTLFFNAMGSSSNLVRCSYTFAQNTWYHIAMVRNGSTNYLFVNGISQTLTVNGYTGGSAGSGTLNVGAALKFANYNHYITGYISNFRIVNGTALYTTNFTPPSAPLTAIAGTQLLTCQSNRLIDNSANAFAVTKAGDVTVSPFDPFVPDASYATYGSTYFDGTGDYLTVASNAAFAFGTSNFTVEGWLYLTVNQNFGTMFISSTTGVGNALHIQINSANKVRVTNETTELLLATNAISLNTWTHVAVVRSGSTLSIYQNGILNGSITNSTDFIQNGAVVGYEMIGGNFYYTGYINDVRVVKGTALYTTNFTPPSAPLTAITNTSLLTCQTNQPTNNQTFLDNSTNAFPITRTGGVKQGSFSPYGANWSNYFNGTTDYLTLPSSSNLAFGTGDFCVEMWYYQQANAVAALFSNSVSSAGGDAQFEIQIAASTFYPTLMGWATAFLTSSVASTPNAWNHIAVCRSGTTLSMFLNGTRTATTTTSNNFSSTNAFLIGRQAAAASAYMNGYISNLRVVKGSSVYTPSATTITIPTQPLTTITNTQLLTCQSPNFTDNSLNSFAITPGGTPSTQKFNRFATVTQTPLTYSTYFDGTGDYLTLNGSPGTTFTGNFTLEAWVYVINFAASRAIICIGDAFGNPGVMFFIDTAGKLGIAYANSRPYTGSGSLTANTWNHVAFVRNSGVITGYINGVSQGTLSTVNTFSGTTSYIGLERYNGGAGGVIMYGYMSNLRIVNGTAVYTTNFTPPTTPLTAVSDTGLLACQSSTLVDNSTNQFTITAFGDAVPRQQNPFGFTTSAAQDYSTATFGGSVYLDGNGDFLTTSTNTAFAFGTGDFTVEFWTYIDKNGDNRYTEFSAGGLLYSSGSGSVGPMVYYVGGARISSSTLSLYTWYHVALVRSSGTTKLYLNGTQAGSSYTDATDYGTAATNVIIGTDRGSNTQFLQGYMSDLRITKGTAVYKANFVPPTAPLTAVTNTTLLLNMDKAAIADKSGKMVLETFGDAKTSTAIKKYGTASMSFDGSGDGLYCINNEQLKMGTGDYTVEFWMYQTSAAGNQVILEIGRASTAAGVGFQIDTVSGSLTVYYGPTIATAFASAVTPTLNTWNHIAMTRQSGSTKFFVNGVQAGSAFTDNTNYTQATLWLGSNAGAGSAYFSGYIDDLRITKGYARYTANFTPPSSALLTK